MFRLLAFFWRVRRKISLVFALFKDRRIPLWKKIIPLVPLLYLISPLNLISFAIPIIGQIDDLMVIMLSTKLLKYFISDDIWNEHQHRVKRTSPQPN